MCEALQYPVNMGRDHSRRRRRARQVGDVLKSESPGVAKLMKKARQVQFLDQKLSALLDPGMKENVQVAALHGQCLVLVTPSAALATRLRMDADSLMASLHRAGVAGVSELKVRTAPLPNPKAATRTRRRLPEIARQSLQRFAEDSGDESLAEHIRNDTKP